MSTRGAAAILSILALVALGGCASVEPRALLTAAELDSMIQVEVQPIEAPRSDETVVAALQP